MKVPRRKVVSSICRRLFSSTPQRREIRALTQLPDCIHPSYHGLLSSLLSTYVLLTLAETKDNDLLSLQWPSPPRNVLLVKKENNPQTTEAVIEFAK